MEASKVCMLQCPFGTCVWLLLQHSCNYIPSKHRTSLKFCVLKHELVFSSKQGFVFLHRDFSKCILLELQSDMDHIATFWNVKIIQYFNITNQDAQQRTCTAINIHRVQFTECKNNFILVCPSFGNLFRGFCVVSNFPLLSVTLSTCSFKSEH